MALRHLLVLSLAAVTSVAFAHRGDKSGDDRWNVTGPAWYNTPCGHVGFSVTHGWPYRNWREPCSVPIRVCEFERTTISYPADPDVACEEMIRPMPEGGLKRTYIKRWD